MAWLAVHPSNTLTERLTDDPASPEFTYGFWPPREAERLSGAPTDADPYGAGRDMIRFGVRGWKGLVGEDGQEITPKIADVEIDGRKYPALSDESIDFLIANVLHGLVSQKAFLFNTLTPAQKKTSGLRLLFSGSTADTPAESASPNSTLTPQPSSSESPGNSSEGAPTS